MFRLVNCFAFPFVFISFFYIADAQSIPGGYSPAPRSEYEDLKIKLQNSNIKSALGTENSSVEVVKIVSASQQVVAGMNYRIEATIKINRKSYEYCFKVEQSLPPNPTFNVVCASEKKPCAPCPCLEQ